MDSSIGPALTSLGGHQNVVVMLMIKFLSPGYAPFVCWAAGLKPVIVTYVPGTEIPFLVRWLWATRPSRPGDEFGPGLRYNGGLFFGADFLSVRPGDEMLVPIKGGE